MVPGYGRSSSFLLVAARRTISSRSSLVALRSFAQAASQEDASPQKTTTRKTFDLNGQAVVMEDKLHPRINPVGIQLLSQSLHNQIFPTPHPSSPNGEDIATARLHLKDNNLLLEMPPHQPQIDFQLPKLQGKTIDEHFYHLGIEESEPWLTLAEDLAVAPTPSLPPTFAHTSGWTRYDPDTGSHTPVPYPEGETMLTFDVEVLYKIHPYPVIGAACSPTHWYTWISPWLLSESTQQEHLIPLGPPEVPRVIVGHNVGYDRGRIKEEYSLALSRNRFLDTMSFHVATQGVSGPQRGMWLGYWKSVKAQEKQRMDTVKALRSEIEVTKEKIANGEMVEQVEETVEKKAEDNSGSPFTSSNVEVVVQFKTINLAEKLRGLEDELENLPPPAVIDSGKKRRVDLAKFGEAVVAESTFDDETLGNAPVDRTSIYSQSEAARRIWEDVTATNGLAEVFKLHHHGSELDKSARDAFSAENPYEVRQDLDNLIRYCASDVHATHRVYKKVFPRYRRVCPSPVSFAGQLKMGSAILPIDQSWDDYVERSESTYVKLNINVRQKLAALAEDARKKFVEPALDWKPPLKDTHALVALECPDDLRGDPWLSQLDWTPKKAKWMLWKKREHLGMSTVKTKADEGSLMPVNWTDLSKSKVIPPLLGLKWRGYLLVWSVEHGWVYRVEESSESSSSRFRKEVADGIHLPPLVFTKDADQSLQLEAKASSPKVSFHGIPIGVRKSAMKVSGWLSKSFTGKPASKLHLSCDDGRVLDMARLEDWNGLKEVVKDLLVERGLSEKEEKEEEGGVEASSSSSGATELVDGAASASSSSLELSPPSPDVAGDSEPSDSFYLKASDAALEAKWWPAWYLDLFKPRAGYPRDFMNLSVKVTLAASLLRLTWLGHPLYKSREFGWVYRVPKEEIADDEKEKVLVFADGLKASTEETLTTEEDARTKAETMKAWKVQERANKKEKKKAVEEAGEEEDEDETSSGKKTTTSATKKRHPDIALYNITLGGQHSFLKVPHPKGEHERVGSMITKTSVKDFEANILSSVFPAAREAIDMNAQCSYWVSVRSRVNEQMVVRESSDLPMGFKFGPHVANAPPLTSPDPLSTSLVPAPPRTRQGLIIPQVVVMGTITRRAIEKTWLTASNAKKNRVGSELKAMVRAPEGYSIVGADVDSEELWIAGLMGDAQIGLHGGSAIGWMTLEGTKAAGTDVHSKTASITGTTRDAAKVFNYSRIYGAGVKHATQLLMDSMKPPDVNIATQKAQDLYVATKGNKINWKNKNFHVFWHGGTESYLFNAMEQVARNSRPRTPALACGITTALQEEYLEKATDHMTSRINWAVQSSGVDYLHLLIVATDYLCRTYDIDARYLISVHDEVRYLVKNEDTLRATLALQIANLWTRSQFAFKLGMEDLPQGVGFFSAVDVDFVLRKEVFMECVTPSNPFPIPPGQVLDIHQTLEKTGGTLHRDGSPMEPTLGNLFNSNHLSSSSSSSSNLPSSSLPPPIPTLTASPSTTQIQTRSRPYLAPPPFRTSTQEAWKRFYLKAQSMKDEKDIDDLWIKSKKPSDPLRTLYFERHLKSQLTKLHTREVRD
ncbi:DNA polymerase family A-domain-containing protein [Mrakia frigida]|uniref:DNA-directed DNA polymerase gamma MIP1 n=1 Tax=Mrakia frigida TaxID=29902 RepID=UPI003FCBF73C